MGFAVFGLLGRGGLAKVAALLLIARTAVQKA